MQKKFGVKEIFEKLKKYVDTSLEYYQKALITGCNARNLTIIFSLLICYFLYIFQLLPTKNINYLIYFASLTLLYNFVVYFFAKIIKIGNLTFNVFLFYLTPLLDIVVIMVFIYLTGGIRYSPFIFLFLVLIVIQILNLDVVKCLYNGIIVITALFVCYFFPGILSEYALPEESAEKLPFFTNIGLAFSLLFAVYITYILKKRKKQVESLYNENVSLYDKVKHFNNELEEKVKFATGMLTEVNTELKKKIIELSALEKVGRAIGSELDLDRLSNIIVENVCDLLDSRTCLLLIDRRREDNFEVYAYSGVDDDEIYSIKNNPDKEIISAVLNAKKALLFDGHDEAINAGINLNPAVWKDYSILVIPIIYKDKVIAILILGNTSSGKKLNYTDAEMLSTIASESAVAIENAWLYENLQENYYNTVVALTRAIEARDPYLQGHSERVANYATLIAKEMELSLEEIEMLQFGAILHDVGKIGIREDLLNKPGKLTPEEYEEVLKHTVIGESIVEPVQSLKYLCPMIRWHHERHDGNGLPDRLSPQKQTLLCQILTIADAFDAMTSERPYRARPLAPGEAISELLRESGTRFNPRIVEIAVSIFRQRPAS